MRVMWVSVKPNSRQSSLVQAEDGQWFASLKSPPVDGKANKELIALIAAHCGCAKSKVQVKSGSAARLKQIIIQEDT